MKKALPILFVASTVVVTAASLTVATNGGFTQLRAADNSVEYIVTFTSADIKSSSVKSGWPEEGTLTFSKTTKSGFEFGCTARVIGDDIELNRNGHMAFAEMEDEQYGEIHMTFEFHNVLSAVSVVLNGIIWINGMDRSSATYTNSTQTADGYTIAINEIEQGNFEINSIVVKYTCSY